MNRHIHILDWGLRPYQEAWDEQERIFRATIAQKELQLPTSNHLIFCEHPHVYTLGTSGNEQNLLIDYIQLNAGNAQFIHTNRGGDITYHGPGQLVGYPIFDLTNFKLGLKNYIYLLEECVIVLLKHYGLCAQRLPGATGVWMDATSTFPRKICAIGVRSSKYVTMHGLALNIHTDLSYFKHINPCGFTDKGVTSMQVELQGDIDAIELKRHLGEIFRKIFFDTELYV